MLTFNLHHYLSCTVPHHLHCCLLCTVLLPLYCYLICKVPPHLHPISTVIKSQTVSFIISQAQFYTISSFIFNAQLHISSPIHTDPPRFYCHFPCTVIHHLHFYLQCTVPHPLQYLFQSTITSNY